MMPRRIYPVIASKRKMKEIQEKNDILQLSKNIVASSNTTTLKGCLVCLSKLVAHGKRHTDEFDEIFKQVKNVCECNLADENQRKEAFDFIKSPEMRYCLGPHTVEVRRLLRNF